MNKKSFIKILLFLTVLLSGHFSSAMDYYYDDKIRDLEGRLEYPLISSLPIKIEGDYYGDYDDERKSRCDRITKFASNDKISKMRFNGLKEEFEYEGCEGQLIRNEKYKIGKSGILEIDRNFSIFSKEEKIDFLKVAIKTVSKKIESIQKINEMTGEYFNKDDIFYYDYNINDIVNDKSGKNDYYMIIAIDNSDVSDWAEVDYLEDVDVAVKLIKEEVGKKNKIIFDKYNSDKENKWGMESIFEEGFEKDKMKFYNGTKIKLYKSKTNINKEEFEKYINIDNEFYKETLPGFLDENYLEFQIIKDDKYIIENSISKFWDSTFYEKIEIVNKIVENIKENEYKNKDYFYSKIELFSKESYYDYDKYLSHYLKRYFSSNDSYDLYEPYENNNNIRVASALEDSYRFFEDVNHTSENLWLYVNYRINKEKFLKDLKEKIKSEFNKVIDNKDAALKVKGKILSMLKTLRKMPSVDEIKEIKTITVEREYGRDRTYERFVDSQYEEGWTKWQKFLYRQEIKKSGAIKDIDGIISELVKDINKKWDLEKEDIFLNKINWWDDLDDKMTINLFLDNITEINSKDEYYIKVKWNGINKTCNSGLGIAKSGEQDFEIPQRIYKKSNGWLNMDAVGIEISKKDLFSGNCSILKEYELKMNFEIYKKERGGDKMITNDFVSMSNYFDDRY